MQILFKKQPPVRAHRVILLRSLFFANIFEAEGNSNLKEELTKLDRDAVESLISSVIYLYIVL